MADGVGGDETVGTELVSGGMAGAWGRGLRCGRLERGLPPLPGRWFIIM